MSEENSCIRGRTDCTALSSQVSECGGSFFCVGYNAKKTRVVKGDRFTCCFKNDTIDDRGHWDKRDLLDQVMVMTHALSIDQSIMVNECIDDNGMNEANLI